MAIDTPVLLEQQRSTSLPIPDSVDRATGLIIPPVRSSDRITNLPEEAYSLSSESHMVRFMKTLIGDSGAGALRKAYMFARLGRTLGGTNFLDLDQFWGTIFSIPRSSSEVVGFDPYTELATNDEWRDAFLKDASYRNRIQQLARAFGFGGTPTGIEVAAEAVLGTDVDVYEEYVSTRRGSRNWGQVASAYSSWSELATAELRWINLSTGASTVDVSVANPNAFTVRPKRPITERERFDLIRVLNRLKPARALMHIDTNGSEVHDPVTPTKMVADSNFWSVKASVLTSSVLKSLYERPSSGGVAKEQPRPPFSDYQGEAWSYNSEIKKAKSYTSAQPTRDDFEIVSYSDHVTMAYEPSQSILPVMETLAGRSVSDGIMVNNPLWARVSAKFPGKTEPLYFDSISAHGLLGTRLAVGQVQPRGFVHRFWSTPERPYTDRTVENVEYYLGEARLVNYISAEVAKFPCNASVQAFVKGAWVTVSTLSISSSSPSRLRSLVQGPSTQHPQHYGSGHWVKLGGRIDPIETDRIRIQLQRQAGNTPVDRTGNEIPYSLGVRNADMGYRVTSLSDIPRGDGPFAVSSDILGSSVSYALSLESAAGLVDKDVDTIWRCDPQPVNNAVVNLYVDMRDAEGNGQLIDRFYLEPTHIGPSLHLYWSDELPSSDFAASDEPIPSHGIIEEGSIVAFRDGIRFNRAGPSWIDIDSGTVQVDLSTKWWVGVTFNPGFVSTDAYEHQIIDIGGHQIIYRQESIAYIDPDGHEASIDGLSFNNTNSKASIVLAYSDEDTEDFDAGGILWYWQDGQTYSIPLPGLVLPAHLTSTIRLGGEDTISGIVVDNFCMKQEQVELHTADSFFSNPSTYTRKPVTKSGIDNTTNAVLRFASSIVPDDSPTTSGYWYGGPGDTMYADISWTPIARDYTVERGFVHLPPTFAKFWKLEFTNLAPYAHESMMAIDKTVKTHPVTPAPTHLGATSDITTPDITKFPLFKDQARLYIDSFGQRRKDEFSPTEVLVASDPGDADRLRKTSWTYGYKKWNPSSTTPFFPEAGVHSYRVVTVSQNSKLSFIVGLKKLVPYRVNYLSSDDTSVYNESFSDDKHIESLGI